MYIIYMCMCIHACLYTCKRSIDRWMTPAEYGWTHANQQIRGLPVVEAMMQLKFSRKQKGPPIVAKVIQVRRQAGAVGRGWIGSSAPYFTHTYTRSFMNPPTNHRDTHAQNAANLANIRYNLNPEDLVVAEAFVNRANIQKGVMIHGRGACVCGRRLLGAGLVVRRTLRD